MSNITNLRKAGNLNAAYEIAKKNLDEKPDDIWNKRNMAWVLYDFAKQKATAETKDQFLKCLDKLIETDLPDDEEVFYQSTGFLARGMAATMIRAGNEDNEFFNSLFERIKHLKIKKKSTVYSSLMTVMIRTKNWWMGFKSFCEWWGFDNFIEEDFTAYQPDDKAQKVMPLAERAVMAYCKILLERGTETEISDLLPWLDTFAQKHRNYIYLPFYHAKLLMKIGHKDEFFEKMKSFAKKKSGEFWVWDLLGDYFEDNETRLKFFAKGLLCKTKPEMSIKLREKAAFLLRDSGHIGEALSELLFIKKIREKNKWGVAPQIEIAIEQLTKQGTKPTGNNSALFAKLSEGVENIVFGKVKAKQEFTGRITISPSGFGFVKSGDKTIFVPANLLKNSGITDKITVKGEYVPSFDKKKGKEGYKAVRITK